MLIITMPIAEISLIRVSLQTSWAQANHEMRRSIIIITLLLGLNISYAQNDTLYLAKNYVMLRGQKYNQKDSLGHKFGQWFYHGLKGDIFGIVDWDGELWCGSEFIELVYRPLVDNEYNGIKKVVSEKVDSVKRYIEGTYQFIYNKVPKENYYIRSQGQYVNDKKVEEWRYYYENDALNRMIIYREGIPYKNFEMYYKDGSLMMSFIKLSNGRWKLVRYSKKGSVIMAEEKSIDSFKDIY